MTDLPVAGVVGIQWGDVPSWVSAAVTMFAFIFAVVAVVVARRTFQLESERDRVNTEIRHQQDVYVRRAQSALVSAWWGTPENLHAAELSLGSWGAFLRNASETPVYKANMTVVGAGHHGGQHAMEFAVLPPTKQPVFHPIALPRLTSAIPRRGAGHPGSDYRVSLRFTDAAGIRWARDEYGALRELDANLLIWTSPEGAAVLRPFTADFLASYGVTTTLDTAVIAGELERKFMAAAASDKDGPDILIGPHDWVGSLVEQQLVEPIVLSDDRRSAFESAHLAALSVNGGLYGVPAFLDTVALFRNTDLVPEPPQSMEDLIATGQGLKDRGLVSEILVVPVDAGGDPFHVWPLLTSAGGWLFGQTPDGAWDPANIGIDSAETVAAFGKLRMLAELGILRPDMTRLRSFEVFGQRQAAFLLAACGAVVPGRGAGVNFAVSAVPPFRDGRRSEPFLAVNGFYVARHGRNKTIASDLVPDYLTRVDVTEAFGRMAHVVPLELSDGADPAIAEFHAVCATARPMPTFSWMQQVWALLSEAELALIGGHGPAEVARSVGDRIRVATGSAPISRDGVTEVVSSAANVPTSSDPAVRSDEGEPQLA